MNFYKRIISLFLIFSICISSMVTVASAVDERASAPGFTQANFVEMVSYGAAIDNSLAYFQNAGEYLGTLWEVMTSGSCYGCPVGSGRHEFLPINVVFDTWEAALLGSDVLECRYCGITYNDFYDQTYNSYLDELQNDLGTTTLIDGGVRVYFTPQFMGASSNFHDYYVDPTISGNVAGARYQFSSSVDYHSSYNTAYIRFKGVPLPFQASSLKFGYDAYNCIVSDNVSFYPNSLAEGTEIYPRVGSLSSNAVSEDNVLVGEHVSGAYNKCLRFRPYRESDKGKGPASFDFAIMCYVDIYPNTEFVDPDTYQISINTRPSTIIGDYGIIGDDGTIIHVEGNVIVDESTNTVYNPVTNTTNNYTDYAFDYSDRSYNLTLEDGSTLRVVYGDENITIEEGDTIYNIYYLIPNVPGDDPGSDDDPGDVPGGEDWSWWRKAWQEFTDKLFGILGNGSTVNPDNAPSVPDDEESGDKGYTIIDLFVVLKDGTWAFITGIVGTAFDGFTSFVDAVSSAGGFFTFFDEESQEGILFIPLEDGETIWD